ncbi:sulfatase-like hydrolase/transferase [bacterium]|nr:sulfatase-like hydrolase/transferase [bacterium]
MHILVRFIVVFLALSHSFLAFAQERKPNVLIIITDDQRFDSFNETFMPRTYERVARQGIVFDKAFVTTSLCCPSRASIFTGLLARSHGIVRNGTRFRKSNFQDFPKFPEKLRAAGYYTGLIGKYLNDWKGDWRKEEFDYWISFRKGVLLDWFNYNIIKNDKVMEITNQYITDKLRNYAIKFLDKARKEEKPFLLYFSTTAPHAPATPHPRHAGLYPGLAQHRPLSFNEPSISDKPDWLQQILPLSTEEINGIDFLRLQELQSLAAVDEAVDDIMTYLADAGMLDDTLIIFLSDNGLFWGEHRLTGKDLFYEEASHVPFAIRYPPLVDPASPRVDSNNLVSNIDIAPTIYEVTGVEPPAGLNGISLVPLIQDPTTRWRKYLLLEGWPDTFKGDGAPSRCNPPYTAIRTKRYLYAESYANTGTRAGCIFSVDQKPELYDLLADPLQQENVLDDPRYANVRRKMKRLLDRHGYVEFPH